jgi:hypothetical protein
VRPPNASDPRPRGASGISLTIEDDPPPVVRALASDLAARLEDPAFAEATARVRGAVSLRDSSTPQSATIRIDDDGVAVSHGLAETAELHATVDLPGIGEPRLEGADHYPVLAQWVKALLSAPLPEWPEGAARFWSVLTRMPGAPAALRVVDLETGNDRRYGSPDARAYEVHGRPEDLAAVFCGRDPLVDAAFDGRIFLRGSFPELSVLSGAGFRVRYEAADRPGETEAAPGDGGGGDA